MLKVKILCDLCSEEVYVEVKRNYFSIHEHAPEGWRMVHAEPVGNGEIMEDGPCFLACPECAKAIAGAVNKLKKSPPSAWDFRPTHKIKVEQTPDEEEEDGQRTKLS